jgi:hypothetical protein
MKFLMTPATLASALLLLVSMPMGTAAAAVSPRQAQCQFPTNDNNLVPITPQQSNAGWAMGPDERCLAGQYCPYACKPGMLMAQWQPNSTPQFPSSRASYQV